MRLVLDRLPVAAPFEAEPDAERAHGFVGRGFVEVATALEYADVERDAEVVVGVAAACVGHDAAGLAPTLLVEGVLLFVCARAGDDLDGDADGSGALDERTRDRLSLRQQRGDVPLAAFIGERCRAGRNGRLADDGAIDGAPRLQPGIAVHGDTHFFLHRTDGGIECHFA